MGSLVCRELAPLILSRLEEGGPGVRSDRGKREGCGRRRFLARRIKVPGLLSRVSSLRTLKHTSGCG